MFSSPPLLECETCRGVGVINRIHLQSKWCWYELSAVVQSLSNWASKRICEAMCRVTVKETSASCTIRTIAIVIQSCFVSHKVNLLFIQLSTLGSWTVLVTFGVVQDCKSSPARVLPTLQSIVPTNKSRSGHNRRKCGFTRRKTLLWSSLPLKMSRDIHEDSSVPW